MVKIQPDTEAFMKKQLLLATAFSLLLVSFPLVSQTADKPRLAVFGFINQTGDDSFTIPAETASSNILITMKMLNLYQVTEPDTIPRSLTEASLDQWCARNNIDFVIFGTLTKRPDDTQDYQIDYFSRSTKKITDKKSATGESVLDVFSITDTLTDALLGTIVKSKISFGSLQFVNTGINADYDVYLDDIFIQTNPAKFERIPSGAHTIRVVQKETGKDIVAQKLTIQQNKSDTLKFEMKTPSPTEKIVVVETTKTVTVPAEPAPVENGTYEEGLADGTKQAKGEIAYFFAGCCLGVIGVIIPAVIEPTIPADLVVGKSSGYIQGFREAYKAKIKSENLRNAAIGLGTSVAVGCISYIAVYAWVLSVVSATY